MAVITSLMVVPRGIGPATTPILIADPIITCRASATGILWVRNRGSADLNLTITIPDSSPTGLGDRVITNTVPPTAQRFYSLVAKMADPTTNNITIVCSGDLSNADCLVLERG